VAEAVERGERLRLIRPERRRSAGCRPPLTSGNGRVVDLEATFVRASDQLGVAMR
jgi:hypothetical protein